MAESGADPGFFLAGGALLRNGVTDWCRKQILIQNTSCIRKPQVTPGGGGVRVHTSRSLPLGPPLRVVSQSSTPP